MNENKGIMPTKIELTLDQSQQGVSDDVLHSTVANGNPSRVKLKQLCGRKSYALSWKPCQGDSLNLLDHRYKRQCCSLNLAESDSLPHAHAQTIKTYYCHQDSSIKKAKVHTRQRLP
ncbi:hypothetical protein Tco_1307930 [Tanacetum coccineum]